MEIKISPKTKKELQETMRDYGYKTEKDFIEDSIWHRILELKRISFSTLTREIREKMRAKGVTEEEILEDFDKFYHQK